MPPYVDLPMPEQTLGDAFVAFAIISIPLYFFGKWIWNRKFFNGD